MVALEDDINNLLDFGTEDRENLIEWAMNTLVGKHANVLANALTKLKLLHPEKTKSSEVTEEEMEGLPSD